MALTKQWENDRIVDRAMWYMFKYMDHGGTDDHGHGVHVCRYGSSTAWHSGRMGRWFKLGHALNVFCDAVMAQGFIGMMMFTLSTLSNVALRQIFLDGAAQLAT